MLRIGLWVGLVIGATTSLATTERVTPRPLVDPLRMRDLCRDAMSRSGLPSRLLPKELEIGAETIHRDPMRVVSIFAPVPRARTADLLLDMNAKAIGVLFPSAFVVADGGRNRALLGVDTSSGRPLRACLDRLARALTPYRSQRAFFPTVNAVLSALMGIVPESGLEWDMGLPRRGEDVVLERLYRGVFREPVGNFPVTAPGRPIRRDVVPFEDYLQRGRGYCIQKAIFASLLLETLKIPHRVVNGATESSGHTWLELESGEWLDPTWGLFERPTTQGAAPGWKRFGSSYLYPSQIFPYLSVTP